MREITPIELFQELQGENPPKLLDVREPYELDISRLDALDAAIPMAQIPGRLGELDREANWVVICRVGSRSGIVSEYLAALGFNVKNLATGMNGWSQTVDPSKTIY